MFRLMLIQTRKSFEFSILTSSFQSIRRSLHESNPIIDETLASDLCVLKHGTEQSLVKRNQLPLRKTIANHYTTNATAVKSNQSKSLEHFIKELEEYASNETRLSRKDLKLLLNKLKAQRVTGNQALDILRLCTFGRIDQNLSETVKNICKELKQQNHEFHTQHYNYLLQFVSENANTIQTQKIFDEMITDGNQPDAISYRCLLSAYCKDGNLEKAHEICDMMKQDNLDIDESSYNYLIQCQIICGNIDAAGDAIIKLTNNGFEINRDTLIILLRHYAKIGDAKNVEKTINVLKAKKINILNRDILQAICDSAVNGHVDLIELLFQHLKPNAELKTAIPNAITLFVANRQSRILPRIIKLDKTAEESDIKTMYKYLINDMVQLNTHENEFNATIKLIEADGITLENNFELFKSALKSASEKVIRQLLMHMKMHGMEVTELAFEKLFQLSGEKGIDDVVKIVNLMCTDFNIQPQITYIRDVIFPALSLNDNEMLALTELRRTKIPIRNVIKALVNSSLNRCDFHTAIDLLNNYQSFYANKLITQTLLNAYATTGDVQNFVRIVRIIFNSFSKIHEYYRNSVLTDAEVEKKRMEFVGEMLYSSIAHTPIHSKRLPQLLEAFIKQELTTNPNQIAKIQNKLLKVDAQSAVGRLLMKLSTEKVHLKGVNLKHGNDLDNQSAVELEILLNEQRAAGRNVAGTEKLLFLAHIREGNVQQVESMLASGHLNITHANYAKLIELYARIGNLNRAMSLLKEISEKNLDFKLDPTKTAQLALLMYENNFNFDEIEALLYTQRQDKVFSQVIPFEQLLQRLAAAGHTQLVDRLFATLVKFNYINATIETTGPLITVHIKNDSYSDAVAKYEYLAKKYKFLPMSVILFKTLIQNNEKELLQRAYNVYEMIRGKSDASSHLAFAFSECGQNEMAKSIFQSDSITDLTKYIGKECRKYLAKDDADSAKLLLKSTRGIACDRRIIYQTILDIYIKQNCADEALELWTDIANDDILPLQSFIDKLAKFLKSNNIELPTDLNMKTTENLKNK